jgi:hypothetical protein
MDERTAFLVKIGQIPAPVETPKAKSQPKKKEDDHGHSAE